MINCGCKGIVLWVLKAGRLIASISSYCKRACEFKRESGGQIILLVREHVPKYIERRQGTKLALASGSLRHQ